MRLGLANKINAMIMEQQKQSTEMMESLGHLRGSIEMTETIKQMDSPSQSSESDKGVDVSDRHTPRTAQKKHRRGRHRRRKQKPYSRMTMDEREKYDARAAKREAELVGKPSAPWNTTQFIMEDRGKTEVKLPSPRMSRTMSLDSSLSDEDFYESPEDDIFEHGHCLEQGFESTYHQVASERLQGMGKGELIEECLYLEEERDKCRKELEGVRVNLIESSNENAKLREEVEKLKSQLSVEDGVAQPEKALSS